MTLEETIEILRVMQNEKVDYAELVCAPAFASGYEYVYPEPEDYAIEEAIKALKEVQQYREIGTVEECRAMASVISKAETNELAKIIDEWLSYKKIGTVEECREAMEKQIPKNSKIIHKSGAICYNCPSCGLNLMKIKNNIQFGHIPMYCEYCGQAIKDEN